MDTKHKLSTALDRIFNETGNFVVIGLTGRTGSGCSTAADILTTHSLKLPEAGESHYQGNERRKYKIIKKFIEVQWKPFKWIQIRSVITRYILELNFDQFTSFTSSVIDVNKKTITEQLSSFRTAYEEAHTSVASHLSSTESTLAEINKKKERAFHLYIEYLPKFSDALRAQLQALGKDAYTRVYQTAGDNIRCSGKANSNDFDPQNLFIFPQTINKIIKSIRHVCTIRKEPCYIVVDAIRNPYEAIFLRERYADFHLVSINTSNENRLAYLRDSRKFSSQQIEKLDEKEYPKKLEGHHRYTSQNIQKCIEIADIHINNPKTDQHGHSELRCQLAWYASLMIHPGLVMPTSIESCMQIAYSVKQNSGCISRQVGAVVTDATYSVKAVGWNNTAQGQVPCLLRSADDLIQGIDAPAYSNYERNDTRFRSALKLKFACACGDSKLGGRSLSFCFKDLQNEVEDEKNQVHTRSLHAEENAFLQISKFGGAPLRGGILFTTASPCELCAKKAYQLGLSQIIYIDPYPGIATSHVLSSGEHAPILNLFRGAIGRAFYRLYQPVMPYKDELDLLLSIPKYKSIDSIKIHQLEEENTSLKSEIERLNALLTNGNACDGNN
ncbi:hypothetical protein DF141_04065 [Burkholderia cenocepacia]|nr:hypothetical protein DF141_04065 [Burkholderia cenocepacia]RQZ96851.1 hypothetical protein DF058_09030 [Burkholderia cenocepacia]RRA19176.1 hypothetical protein DF059_02495 [Burkholderia cenocepacia]